MVDVKSRYSSLMLVLESFAEDCAVHARMRAASDFWHLHYTLLRIVKDGGLNPLLTVRLWDAYRSVQHRGISSCSVVYVPVAREVAVNIEGDGVG